MGKSTDRVALYRSKKRNTEEGAKFLKARSRRDNQKYRNKIKAKIQGLEDEVAKLENELRANGKLSELRSQGTAFLNLTTESGDAEANVGEAKGATKKQEVGKREKKRYYPTKEELEAPNFDLSEWR